MGAQPGSRLVQLSSPRHKEFALRREDINECFLEFTIKPGEVVLFSHVVLRCHKQELYLEAKSQVGNPPRSCRYRSTEKFTRPKKAALRATCRPISSRSCLSFSPNNARSSSGHKTITMPSSSDCAASAKSRATVNRKPRRLRNPHQTDCSAD